MTDALFLILLALSQVADIVTTRRILALGGYEMNPLVRFLMDKLGGGWIPAKLALTGVPAWFFFTSNLGWVVLLMAGLTFAVVAHNIRVIRRLSP